MYVVLQERPYPGKSRVNLRGHQVKHQVDFLLAQSECLGQQLGRQFAGCCTGFQNNLPAHLMNGFRGGWRGIPMAQTVQRAVDRLVIQEQPQESFPVMITADCPEAGHGLLHLQGDQLQYIVQIVLILLIAIQLFLPGHVGHRVTGK